MDSYNASPLFPHRASLRVLGGEATRSAMQPADWQALLGGPGLNARELQALQGLPMLRWVHAGELVFSRQQAATALYAVLDGAVGLGLARADEPFQLERTVRGPQWLDASSAWLGGTHAQDAQALVDARLMQLSLPALRALLQREAGLLERMLVVLAGTVHSLTSVTHDLMHKDAERRLAAWLLQRCRCMETGGAQIELNERKRDIAAQLAITPETLSRMMRQLNRKGLIEVHGYSVKVLDLDALKTLARD